MTKFEFLRKIPLFSELPEDELWQLCASIEDVYLDAGEVLFREGDSGDRAYVLQEGRLEILKQSGNREICLAVRHPGDVIGEISLLESVPRSATVRAITSAKLLSLSQQQLDLLMNQSPSVARALLKTVTARLRNTYQSLQESEKLARLGTLSAGIAHELNNPAAAISRSSTQLVDLQVDLNQSFLQLALSGLSTEQAEILHSLLEKSKQAAKQNMVISAIERMDQEATWEDWLQRERLVRKDYDVTALSELGIETIELEQYKNIFPGTLFGDLISLLTASSLLYRLSEEIQMSSNSISSIVKALKSYVYLDQGPVQSVDLREGLESTLVVMKHKLKNGVEVVREYDPNLGKVQAYGGELNQVWTNLIDNAIDAMEGQGRLVLRTRKEDDFAVVEVEDNGPGIPEDVQAKLFTPFFTTKPQGKGTGLGLSIAYNIIQKHEGMIEVISQPSQTCVRVRLPLKSTR